MKDIEKMVGWYKGCLNDIEGYSMRENMTVQGMKLRYAFYFRGKLRAGIKEETYMQHQEEIDSAFAAVRDEIRREQVRKSWITKALAGRLVADAGRSWETGLSYHVLNARVPQNVWKKVAHFFQRVQEGGDMEHPVSGWVIVGKGAEEVEKILRTEAEKVATDEHRQAAAALIAEEKEREAEVQRKREAEARAKQTVQELKDAFRSAEYPEWGKRVEGEVIEDPTWPPSAYGDGRWFVIQKDWIWMIQNNGADGDDWSVNNVRTGGAGAIGKRLPFNRDLAAKIRSLREEK